MGALVSRPKFLQGGDLQVKTFEVVVVGDMTTLTKSVEARVCLHRGPSVL